MATKKPFERIMISDPLIKWYETHLYAISYMPMCYEKQALERLENALFGLIQEEKEGVRWWHVHQAKSAEEFCNWYYETLCKELGYLKSVGDKRMTDLFSFGQRAPYKDLDLARWAVNLIFLMEDPKGFMNKKPRKYEKKIHWNAGAVKAVRAWANPWYIGPCKKMTLSSKEIRLLRNRMTRRQDRAQKMSGFIADI